MEDMPARDMKGQEILEGDMVLVNANPPLLCKIVKLHDRWGINQYTALVKSMTGRIFTAEIDCMTFEKISPERATIFLLES